MPSTASSPAVDNLGARQHRDCVKLPLPGSGSSWTCARSNVDKYVPHYYVTAVLAPSCRFFEFKVPNGHSSAEMFAAAARRRCWRHRQAGPHLSVTMSRTAPSVELWLNVRAARPSVSSSTNLSRWTTRLRIWQALAAQAAARRAAQQRRSSRAAPKRRRSCNNPRFCQDRAAIR